MNMSADVQKHMVNEYFQQSDHDPEHTARATLSLLETRLQRLEFLLTGISDLDGRAIGPSRSLSQARNETQSQDQEELPPQLPPPAQPVTLRLQKLESDLNRLKRLDGPNGHLVRSVDALYKRHPELLRTRSSIIEKGESLQSGGEPLPHVSAATVLAHAPLYHRTSAHLQTLQTLPIPSAQHSTNLINTSPKLRELLDKQSELEKEAQTLKERSARVLEWWVRVGVVGMGEVWEDWENRVENVERTVRRMEGSRRKQLEEDGVR